MKKFILSVIAILIALVSGSSALAAPSEFSFQASMNRTVLAVGETIQLSLTFYGTQSVGVPSVPDIKGFNLRYVGPATRVSIINGKVSSSITHLFNLTATEPGKYNIGPFSMGYKGDVYTTQAIPVEVVKGAVPPPTVTRSVKQLPPPQQVNGSVDDRVFITLTSEKNKIYVNEIVPISVNLYVSGLSMRDIQYPQFPHENFSVNDFTKPSQSPQVLKGVMYEVLKFDSSMYGTTPGDFTVGPVTIQGNVISRAPLSRRGSIMDDDDFFNSFFDRMQVYPVSLESDPLKITVLPLPQENKPENFSGAVGNFDFDYQVTPKKVKVGDPVTIMFTVKGKGNLNSVNITGMMDNDDFKVYQPHVVKQEDGTKVFEQVIIPKKEGQKQLPETDFSYFDPSQAKYVILKKGPLQIEVLKPDKEERIKIIDNPKTSQPFAVEEVLGKDILYIKGSPGNVEKASRLPFFRDPVYLGINAVLLFMPIAVFLMRMMGDRFKNDRVYAGNVMASRLARKYASQLKKLLRSQDTGKFYDGVFKALQAYLGNKFRIPAASITSSVVEDTLSGRNIEPEILELIKKVFNDCDMARYALSNFDRAAMEDTYSSMEKILRNLERIRS